MAFKLKSKEEILKEIAFIKAAQKDPAKFGILYEKYHHDIFIFIYKRVDHKEIANDLTSSVFLKALKSLHSFQHRGVPFSAWLYRIASNETNLFFRTTKKMRAINIEKAGLNKLKEEVEDDDSSKVDDYERIVLLFEHLNQDEVELIELRFFEECSFKEIAIIKELTEVNAKVKIHRIIKKLKSLLINT